MPIIKIARLNERGLNRVLNGRVGMTFIIDGFTSGVAGDVAHVRDYRFFGVLGRDYQIWSIPADGYEIISTETAKAETLAKIKKLRNQVNDCPDPTTEPWINPVLHWLDKAADVIELDQTKLE